MGSCVLTERRVSVRASGLRHGSPYEIRAVVLVGVPKARCAVPGYCEDRSAAAAVPMPPPRRGCRATFLFPTSRSPTWNAVASPTRAATGRIYPIGGMFQLQVDDEIALVLAEERHAQAMTDLIVRNQGRLARWEPWAEQPATLESTRAYIRAALEDFVRGRQISTIITVDGGRRFVGRCGMRINPYAGSGDIGYWIDGEFEGRGITSRSARALVSSVFAEVGLGKVELRTSAAN